MTTMRSRRGRLGRAEQLAAGGSEWAPSFSRDAGLSSAVAGAPLFRGFDRDELDRAVERFDEGHFASGRRIVLEGLRGSDFFLIVAGSAAVLVDGWRVAGLGPGDFFGEIAILGDGLRSASVRAETPLHCLVLPNGRLEQVILDHPQLGINLIRTVISRYQGIAGRRQPPASELVTA